MQLLVAGFGLLEAARWYPKHGLLFSDMTQGGVFRLGTRHPRREVVVPHRKGVGGLVAHRDGGLVVAGRNVAHKAPDGTTTVIMQTAADEMFFNDLTADRRGRLFVGSVGMNPASAEAEDADRACGRLYRVDLDGSITVLADDVLVSNGLGTAPTDELLYHVDSHRHTVWVFTERGEREIFADSSEYPGVPDGLAVAADGSVWVAIAGGGVVVGWSADGRRIAELPVPQALVTSVCFGERDLRSMFVLTGHNDEYPDTQGGSVYVRRADRRGLPAPACAVALSIPAGRGE